MDDGASPNASVGSLEINADVDSAGGIVTLSGAEISSASGTGIETNGGNLTATTFAGDLNIQGAIDTRTSTRDAEGNERVGGGINFVAQASRVPNSGANAGESIVVGGDIVVAATIQTDGGAINMLSTGGDIDIQANLDTSLVEPLAADAPGGDIGLRARQTTFEPLSETDTEAVTTGGRIALSSSASFLTDGGDVTLGPDLSGGGAAASEIVINGVIDTRGASDTLGGVVILETESDSASVTIADTTRRSKGEVQVRSLSGNRMAWITFAELVLKPSSGHIAVLADLATRRHLTAGVSRGGSLPISELCSQGRDRHAAGHEFQRVWAPMSRNAPSLGRP